MTTDVISSAKRRSRSEGESDRYSPEQISSPAPSTRSTKQQIRHRASIACASCRERRIRCVVGEGESECTQCRRTGAMCIIKDDDERRRPISKAYMSSLSNRIALLEDMLRERGVRPPPAVHPPKTRQEAQARSQHDERQPYANGRSESAEPQPLHHSVNQAPTPPGSGDEGPDRQKDIGPTPAMTYPLFLQDLEFKRDLGTRQLLCSKGNHVFDQGAGRTRFFGLTANNHVYARPLNPSPRAQSRQAHKAERGIGTLAPSTYDHLMRCFWEYYNSALPVVDEVAFEAGRTAQDPRFYSPFLHLTMLAIGYRFADLDREDVKRLALGNRESTLHRDSKSMLEEELEMPGGIPSVQALLLLADLECGVGRDTAGWMYSGMANRLAFDIGLHVRPGANVSELENQANRRTMAACVMFDRKWALLLGRPTTIKLRDIDVNVLPGAFPSESMGLATASQTALHRQLFELMELAGKVADFQNSTFGTAHAFSINGAEDRAYLHFVGLERLFQHWYRRLPDHLTWTPANIKTAPASFFVLHQQFHVCLILLHRPWAKYGPMSLDGSTAYYPSPESPQDSLHSWMGQLPHQSNRASLSRKICTQHAVRVARIFWHHRQRFDSRKIGFSAVQHAGTAALALMAALAHKNVELDHHSNLRYLQVISSAIYDMSHLYQPAARMYQLLKTMLVDIRSEMVKSEGVGVGTAGGYQGDVVFGSSHWATDADSNCGSTSRLDTIPEEDYAVKRRRVSNDSSIDPACLSPSILNNSHLTCPTPGSSHNGEGLNPGALGKVAGEPNTFDLDFFHASFVDFINNGGNGAVTQNWASTSSEPKPEITENPTTLPTPGTSEQTPSPSDDMDGATPKATAENESQSDAPAAALDAVVDDDTTVDQTIEDWLAEPAKPPSAPTPSAESSSNTKTTTLQQIAHTPLSIPDRTSNHVNPDGTPIHRDPYVVSLETELGFTCDMNMDMNVEINTEMNIDMDTGMGMGMEWTKTDPPSSLPAMQPPMVPVTLDELVVSVEEAVGSARARARARERAASVAVACLGRGGGEDEMEREREREARAGHARRRSELDFLAL